MDRRALSDLARDATRVEDGLVRKFRVGKYLRVSRDPSGRWKSVNDQDRDYARDERRFPEWLLNEEYADNDKSASEFALKERPEFIRLCGDIAAGKIDILWLWEASRFTRDLEVFTPLRRMCKQMKMKWYVHIHRRLYDFTVPNDVKELTRQILEAEEEVARLSVRVRRGVIAGLEDGRPPAKTPYGYRRRYDSVTRVYVSQDADPETAPLVEEIFNRFSQGDSALKIARDLTRRAIPPPAEYRGERRKGVRLSGRPWLASTVKDMVGNVAYLGIRRYGGKLADDDGRALDAIWEADWSALVTVEVFEQCRRQLDRSDRKSFTRPNSVNHLLSYIMTCGVCGSKVQSQPGRHKPELRVYGCVRARCVTVPELQVDAIVLKWVTDYLNRAVSEADFTLAPDLSGKIMAAREGLATARSEHDEALAMRERGEISLKALAGEEKRILAAIESAEAEIQRLSVPAPLHSIYRDDDPGARFLSRDLAVQRQVITEMFTVVAQRTGQGKRFRREQIEVTPIVA